MKRRTIVIVVIVLPLYLDTSFYYYTPPTSQDIVQIISQNGRDTHQGIVRLDAKSAPAQFVYHPLGVKIAHQ